MTLHSTRDGQMITIHHSPSDTHIEEDAQHVRYFYNQLGAHLGEAEHERAKEQVAEHERHEAAKTQTLEDIDRQSEEDRKETEAKEAKEAKAEKENKSDK